MWIRLSVVHDGTLASAGLNGFDIFASLTSLHPVRSRNFRGAGNRAGALVIKVRDCRLRTSEMTDGQRARPHPLTRAP